jgi:predicted RNase H-like HicB family nuclease
MTKYAILIAPTRTGYSAHVPDLPGCVATGRTLREVKQRMAKAVEMHLALMREDGDEIPEPLRVEMVKVA